MVLLCRTALTYYSPVRDLLRFFVLVAFVPVLVGAQERSDIVADRVEGVMTRRDIDVFVATLFSGYDQPRALYPVEVIELQILSPYPDQGLTPVRVQVFIPETTAVRGAYLFAPGSTGLINPCRASREHVAGIRWGLYRAHVLSVAAQGFVGILPDYPGFEDWALTQPYFHRETEAALVFAAFHAVNRRIADRIPGGLGEMPRVAAGFSQGGHAAFAAADYSDRFGGNLPLDGVIGYGPTTDIEALFLDYPGVAPMLIQAFSRIYGPDVFDPGRILQERWATSLEYDTTRQCVGGMQAYYPQDPDQLFRADFLESLRSGRLRQTHPAIAARIAENKAGLDGHGIPALILQGTNDIVVSATQQERFVQELRSNGSVVDFTIIEGARHDTRQIGFNDALTWIDSLSSRSRSDYDATPAYDRRLD